MFVGVLRGDRARFQLFGDTVNTAARMESTGKPGFIQMSQATADLLLTSEKGDWIVAREDKVAAKGKGLMQTYWLLTNSASEDGSGSFCMKVPSNSNLLEIEDKDAVTNAQKAKMERLVGWNVEILGGLISKIVKQRSATRIKADPAPAMELVERSVSGNHNMLEEVVEVVNLSKVTAIPERQTAPIEVDEKVHTQLRSYVTKIAGLYNDNSFHCFEHAR
jgi:hypothetical protein